MEKPKFSCPAPGPKVPFNLSDHDDKIKVCNFHHVKLMIMMSVFEGYNVYLQVGFTKT